MVQIKFWALISSINYFFNSSSPINSFGLQAALPKMHFENGTVNSRQIGSLSEQNGKTEKNTQIQPILRLASR